MLQELVDAGVVTELLSSEYDDTYGLKYALDHQGIVVSNDYYLDYVKRREEAGEDYFKRYVETRTLHYTFVDDTFLPSDDFEWPEYFEEINVAEII